MFLPEVNICHADFVLVLKSLSPLRTFARRILKTFSESFCSQIVRAVVCIIPVSLWHAMLMGALKGFFGVVSVLLLLSSRSAITSKHSAPLVAMLVMYSPVEESHFR